MFDQKKDKVFYKVRDVIVDLLLLLCEYHEVWDHLS